MEGEKVHFQDLLKGFEPKSETTSRLLNNIDVFVNFKEDAVSYSTIDTDSVSSCTFILVTGNQKDRSFAYLSHYPECPEPPIDTPTSTLAYFIDQISANIERHLKLKISSSEQRKFDINELNNLQVLIGGGAEEEGDLVRESFTLLNKSNYNFENLFDNPLSKFFYRQLKCKATILSSTTITASEWKYGAVYGGVILCPILPINTVYLRPQIKSRFDIPSNGTLHFIHVNTDFGLAPGLTITSHFWEVPTEEMPVYRIKIANIDHTEEGI